MSRGPWYESDDPSRVARGAGWRLGVGYLAILVAVLVVGALLWGVKVVTSDVRGQGNAVRQKNDANNRIGAQARFEDLYADIQAADRRLDVLAQQAKANPRDNVARTNYAGAVNYCIDVVSDYNAEARKYLARDFRSFDLPSQIDSVDPATDCKPSQEK